MRKKQTWYAGNRYGAFHRSALLFGVPIGIAFAPLFFLTGYNDKPTALALFGIMATGLCLTSALHDKETRLDPEMARIWFVACIAFILVFLTLCVAAMLVMYLVEQAPSSGNFFWSWDFTWSHLGYPAEEFSQRHRNGILAFTLAGSCYMTVAIGGSLLGAILAWSKTEPKRINASGPHADAPQDPSAIAEILDDEQAAPQDSPEFVVALNGEETTHEPYAVRKHAGRQRPSAAQGEAAGRQGLGNRLSQNCWKVEETVVQGQAQGAIPAALRLRTPPWQAIHHR